MSYLVFSFVGISQVTGSSGWVFCISQELWLARSSVQQPTVCLLASSVVKVKLKLKRKLIWNSHSWSLSQFSLCSALCFVLFMELLSNFCRNVLHVLCICPYDASDRLNDRLICWLVQFRWMQETASMERLFLRTTLVKPLLAFCRSFSFSVIAVALV